MKLNALSLPIQSEVNYTKQNKSAATADNDEKSSTTTIDPAEKNKDNNNINSESNDTTQPDDASQEQIINNINQLQRKIDDIRSNDTLPKEQQQQQLRELTEQLDNELNVIQLTVKKNVSTLVNSLFSSAGSTRSGLLFNHKA
ncbi:hypothetical protein [Pseudoalteromonas mariniglutinosa]|uniref:hypothetical protein n=1 Tax=Pseudoalteromonas mariniglutinosa TaxID=206042 RepID=UPI00384E8F0F